MNIEDFKKLCQNETIQMTQHVINRCRERNIKLCDIKNCIMNGEIIEEYPSDYPFPSALILGITINSKYLHVVSGISDDAIWIITAYYPSNDKWYSDYKIRKE